MENPLKQTNRKGISPGSKAIFDAPVALPAKTLSSVQSIHIEHLKNQYEHLLVLHEYHVPQLNRARNRQLFEQHRGLAETISRAVAQYEALLITSGVPLE